MKPARLALVASLLALAPTPAPASPARADAGPRTVSVHGHAEEVVPNDVATLILGVRARDRDAAQAAGKVDAAGQAVVAAIRAAGVTDADVSTSGYELGRQPDPPDAATRPAVNRPFEASVTFDVTVRDPHRAGAVLTAALTAGANDVSGVRLAARPDRARDDRLRVAAVEGARRTASAMAEAAGMALGDAVSIGTSGGFVRPMAMARVVSSDAAPMAPVVGESRVESADVDVVWEILPKAN